VEEALHKEAVSYFFLARWFNGKTSREDLQSYLDFLDKAGFFEDDVFSGFKSHLESWLNEENIDTDLPKEYTRLFHLPGGVKPYESVYRGEEVRLMQDPWVEVKNFYQKRGWQVENSIYPEDHVSVELSFMGHLIAAGEEEEAKTFFRHHIINWVPDLMKDIINNRNANYYKKVAEYGLSYLKSENKASQVSSLNEYQ